MKKCPFCGEKAVADKIEKIVYCIGCGVEFKADLYHSLDEMVERWDSRIASQQGVEAETESCGSCDFELKTMGGKYCSNCGRKLRTT